MKEKILAKILEIEKELSPKEEQIGLYTGEAGKALFYCYLSRQLATNEFDEKIEKSLIKVFENINDGKFNTTFCSGLSGIIWTIEHLKEKKLVDLDVNFHDAYEMLKVSALQYAELGNFDFLHGADGIVYNLLLLDAADEAFINKWLQLLYKHAVKDKNGFVWETVININTGIKGLNLSLSHGLSSKIIVLAQVVKMYPGNKLASQLLEGSLNYLMQCKNPHSVGCCFPSYINENNTSKHSRLAWCYGDLGNAISLWRAGTILEREELKLEAIGIMLAASKRKDLQVESVADAGFCHGSAGIAHTFNRFYLETGRKEFEEARVYWLKKTLDMASFTDGIAGFKAYSGLDKIYTTETNFLEGVIGIAMVLLVFVEDKKTNMAWDRCFLMN